MIDIVYICIYDTSMNKTIIEEAKHIPVYGAYDVVVVGGGLTGVMAAISARKDGASTVLIESKPFLGGVGTMGLPLQGFYDVDFNKIIKGLPEKFIDNLNQLGGVSEFIKCEMHNPFAIINPETVKLVCQEMLLENNVDVLLHTIAADVQKTDDRITGVFIENKSGRQLVEGKVFIDCSGDGDIACRSGVPFVMGRESDHNTQASTLMFRLDNVNIQKLTEMVLENPNEYDLPEILPRIQFTYNKLHILVGLKNRIRKAQEDGINNIPWDRVCYITCLDNNAVYINMVHVDGKDATTGDGLTEIEMKSRSQISLIHKVLKTYIPGFEHSIFTQSAAWTGIRETRHILGDYILSIEDIEEGKIQATSIVVGGYPIDIHYASQKEQYEKLDFKKIKAYGIPYGCFLPRNIKNLLVAGRCISGTHQAMASARVMGTCMGMGQAVGVAAALAIAKNCEPRELEVELIRQGIRELGGYI